MTANVFIRIVYTGKVYEKVSIEGPGSARVDYASGDPVVDYRNAIQYGRQHAQKCGVAFMSTSSIDHFIHDVPGYRYDEDDFLVQIDPDDDPLLKIDVAAIVLAMAGGTSGESMSFDESIEAASKAVTLDEIGAVLTGLHDRLSGANSAIAVDSARQVLEALLNGWPSEPATFDAEERQNAADNWNFFIDPLTNYAVGLPGFEVVHEGGPREACLNIIRVMEITRCERDLYKDTLERIRGRDGYVMTCLGAAEKIARDALAGIVTPSIADLKPAEVTKAVGL